MGAGAARPRRSPQVGHELMQRALLVAMSAGLVALGGRAYPPPDYPPVAQPNANIIWTIGETDDGRTICVGVRQMKDGGTSPATGRENASR